MMRQPVAPAAGNIAVAAQPQQQQQPRANNDFAALHLEVFEFLCTFHRVKRVQSKDTTQCGQLTANTTQSSDQRAEALNRSLYKILNETEAKIGQLPSTSDQIGTEYFDDWSLLTWSLLLVVNRLEADTETNQLLDYGGKHFQEKIHAALVDLVNKAHRMQPPPSVQPNDQQFQRFYQAYVTALISLHELYTMSQQKCHLQGGGRAEFDAHLEGFRKQLSACLALQREFVNCHGHGLWRQLRECQIRRMTHYGTDLECRAFLEPAVAFYAHMLYNLGVLTARIQGFIFELRSSSAGLLGSGTGPDPVRPLLDLVYGMADVLLGDAIICLEPSVNPILVTNNLFPMKIVSMCRFCFFRDFSLQIVSEEVAQQIQQEMRHRRMFDPPSPIRKSPSAALLAMKPATGVKRNNARASEEGGNTAHKKSDVNSREWIAIPPLFDADHGGWCATYPHLLCTTRQKDSLLDARSAMQTGKRPLFYFHVRAELFSFSGTLSTAHTLSLPFTIATRRNQDCQVQRMMSSYTATCFWLYGTNALDGLLIQWFDGEIDWKHFKLLYSLYFAMNAEVRRTFTDEDFNILQNKMHCNECTEGLGTALSACGRRISFKNVLCPHLHFNAPKCDLRFSIWRSMLELLHLFNDQKTEARHLWECGLLLGFLEMKTVHALLRTLPGCGLVMRLSLVASTCVCITVKDADGELLDLEPLDAKRLQAKNLHDYLMDIIIDEKVDFVLDANREWLHVDQVKRRCQKSAANNANATTQKTQQNGGDAHSPPRTRELRTNVLHAGTGVHVEHKISFTTMRIAVVTCKSRNALDTSNEPDDEFGEHNSKPATSGIAATSCPTTTTFEQQLDELLRAHGKTRADARQALDRMEGQPPSSSSSDPYAAPTFATITNGYHHQIAGPAASTTIGTAEGPTSAYHNPQQQQQPFYLQYPAQHDGTPSIAQHHPSSSSSSMYFSVAPIGQPPPATSCAATSAVDNKFLVMNNSATSSSSSTTTTTPLWCSSTTSARGSSGGLTTTMLLPTMTMTVPAAATSCADNFGTGNSQQQQHYVQPAQQNHNNNSHNSTVIGSSNSFQAPFSTTVGGQQQPAQHFIVQNTNNNNTATSELFRRMMGGGNNDGNGSSTA